MENFKKVLYRILSIVLALTITSGSFNGMTLSVEAEEEFTLEESQKVSVEADLPEDDELFAGYAEQLFYDYSDVETFSVGNQSAGAKLSGDTKLVYDALEPILKQIASGERTSSVIALGKDLTYEGEDYIVDAEIEFSGTIDTFDLDGLLSAVMADYPYELYWFDKVTGCSVNTWTSGSKLYQVIITFYVSQNYQGADNITVNNSYVETAKKAVETAKKIVESYAAKTDYDKLSAYRNEICSLVTYDTEAAKTGKFSVDNDPWQLIHVFDQDSTTNVVCEGYSKAFQYLCDQSSFADNTAACYSVSGVMSSNSGDGPHMWNIVTLGNNNYLVDVTNCDQGSIGYPDKLFMVGAKSGSVSGGYKFTTSSEDVLYTYDENQTGIWGSELLTIASNDYVSKDSQETIEKTTPEIAFEETNATVIYTGETILSSEIPVVNVSVNGENIENPTISYSYRLSGSDDDYTAGLPANVGTYEVLATLAEGENYKGAISDVLTLVIIQPVSEEPQIVAPDVKLYKDSEGNVVGVEITNNMTTESEKICYGYSWDVDGVKNSLYISDTFNAGETKKIPFLELLIPDREYIGKTFIFECYVENENPEENSERVVLDYEIIMEEQEYTGEGIIVNVESDENNQEIYRIEESILPEQLRSMYLTNSEKNTVAGADEIYYFNPARLAEGINCWEVHCKNGEISIEKLTLGEVIPGEDGMKFVWSDVPNDLITVNKEEVAVEKATPVITFNNYNPTKIYDGTPMALPTENEISISHGLSDIIYEWHLESASGKVIENPTGIGKYVLVAFLEETDNTKAVSVVSDVFEIKISEEELAPVELQAKAISCREITLSWSENNRADGYIVYQVGNTGEKKEIFRSSGMETLTYKVTKLAPGTKYCYLVVPYREIEGVIYEGLESQIVSVKTTALSKVTLTAKTVDYSQIKLTWTKNQYADGYYIYRKNGSSSTKIATISKNTTLTYTVAKLAPNTSYTYYVVPYCTVSAKNYTGAASVAVSAKTKALAAVTLKAASVNYNQIKLTWSQNKDAAGYKIYRKNSEGKYVVIKTITSGSTLSYTNTGLSFNKTYNYKIAPIIKLNGTTYTGNVSAAVSAKAKLVTPKINAVKNVNYKTLQISWEKISGASGYEIYRSNSSSSGYKLVKRITSGSTVSYKDATVTPNKTQYYKVRAYRTVDGKRVYGSFSAVKSGKSMFTQVKGLTVKAVDYTTMKINWTKVSGAAKYQVYYSTAKDSGYKLLSTVTSNSYTWKKPTCGTIYYFKVRAIKVENKKSIYGDYSSVVSKKTSIGKPTASAAKKNYSSITISWKKVTGAQKYEVYWATAKNGTYKKLTTTTGTSCTHTGRTVGTAYYYKVRAIRQKSISAFSSVVSAKTSLGKITELKTGKYGSDGFKISWKAANGATSYKVYRATSKLGTYTLLGTVSKTSYVDLDVLSSKVYYYKIIGYRGSAKTATAGPVSASAKFVRQGVDVSEYQGNIDWKKAKKDGIDFAMLRIVKGRTGSMSTDARFEEYYKNATKAGLDVGVYRYCYATSVSEAKKEAKKVLSVLNGRKLDYPVVLDMEDNSLITCGISDSTRSKMVLAFKEIIEDAGYEFAMYANLNWINNYLDMNQLDDVDIWLARWRDYNRGPEYTGKGNLIMWQYSSEGRIDGINGRVDLDVSY